MLDPIEGVSPEGSIVTGADRGIPTRFQTILDEAVASLAERNASTDVYVYGSVATGTAIPGVSDVDLLTIGASSADAEDVATRMSQRYATECRAVDVAVAQASNYIGDADDAYGNRVFLRHYCVYLAGLPRSTCPRTSSRPASCPRLQRRHRAPPQAMAQRHRQRGGRKRGGTNAGTQDAARRRRPRQRSRSNLDHRPTHRSEAMGTPPSRARR